MLFSMFSSSSRNAFIWSGDVISIFASTSVFSISIAVFISAIFASSTSFGIPECTRSLSTTIPFISTVSSLLPPVFFSNFMWSVSTRPPGSAIALTDSTARLVSSSLATSAPFPVIEVVAIFFSVLASSGLTVFAIFFNTSYAFSAANRYPVTINVGCTSCSSKSSARFSSSPPITTALVVPSPTSLSCVFAISTIIFAAGCSMSISFSIVAPSFVITTSPIESTNILSIPFGPNVDLTELAMVFAARMFLLCASFPLVLSLPSFNINIGVPPNCPPMCFFHLYFLYLWFYINVSI